MLENNCLTGSDSFSLAIILIAFLSGCCPIAVWLMLHTLNGLMHSRLCAMPQYYIIWTSYTVWKCRTQFYLKDIIHTFPGHVFVYYYIRLRNLVQLLWFRTSLPTMMLGSSLALRCLVEKESKHDLSELNRLFVPKNCFNYARSV